MTIKPLIVIDNCELTFGLPLEDLFLLDHVHPFLKHLFNATYKTIAEDSYSIEYILDNMQGSIKQRLDLKSKIEQCILPRINKIPGALLWIIRHFIGLLPLPLLASYADGRFFRWTELSETCRKYFSEDNPRKDYKINVILMEDILKLPTANVLFLKEFMNFMRKLIVLPFDEPNIHKYSAIVLVKYYCSALFLRPYHPGFFRNRDKPFFYLLLYMLLKWPDLKKNLQKQQIFYEERHVQTLETIREDDFVESENDEVSKENVSCQTSSSDLMIKPLMLKDKCCCNYGSNYQSKLKEDEQKSPEGPLYGWVEPEGDEIDPDEESSLTGYYGWKVPQLNVPELKIPQIALPSTSSCTEGTGEYIYDEINETIYEDARSSLISNDSPLKNPFEQNLALDLSETTTSKDTLESYEASSTPIAQSVNVNKWAIDIDNYKLCHGIDKEFIEVNDKSKEAKEESKRTVEVQDAQKLTINVANGSATDIKTFLAISNEQIKSERENLLPNKSPSDRADNETNRKSNSSLSPNKSKISLEKFKKAASRIDIFNSFKKKYFLSSSIENIGSKIKYKKMKSTHSNLF